MTYKKLLSLIGYEDYLDLFDILINDSTSLEKVKQICSRNPIRYEETDAIRIVYFAEAINNHQQALEWILRKVQPKNSIIRYKAERVKEELKL